jgi:hypothetical protein
LYGGKSVKDSGQIKVGGILVERITAQVCDVISGDATGIAVVYDGQIPLDVNLLCLVSMDGSILQDGGACVPRSHSHSHPGQRLRSVEIQED